MSAVNRPAAILLLGVFFPSLLLGWLAFRTVGEQQVVLEKRTAELFQSETAALAAAARAIVEAREEDFSRGVEDLLQATAPAELAARFVDIGARLLPETAPFAISPEGVVAPRRPGEADLLTQNRAFLANADAVPLFQAVPESAGATRQRASEPGDPGKSKRAESKEAELARRAVQPQKIAPPRESLASPPVETGLPELADFRTATAGAANGVLARFVNNELQWILWTRPPAAAGHTFGCIVPAATMEKWLARLAENRNAPDVVLALLNERARPVSLTQPGFDADWTRPFVASAVGDLLPFWEAAAYAADPAKLDAAAGAARLAIGATIALALSAILAAGWFVWNDARLQVALATRKTDFVSNVSHELKTPLTSIRMFSELLATPAGEDPARRRQYLRVITLESERLSRLINNVLDFARIEKKRKSYNRREIDLHSVAARVWEGTCLHLEQQGWTCRWTADDPPYPVLADEDAMSQILVNLFSNAEKYAASGRSLEFHTWREQNRVHAAVLDRGPGVPAGEETKIFEAFYRAGDTLDNPVTGSGLGLALAHRLAVDHGGSLTCTNRRGGGACFTLALPLL